MSLGLSMGSPRLWVALTLALLSSIPGPAAAQEGQQKPDLQAQVLSLQGGRGAVTSDPASGLLLPPSPRAVAWLRDFWATGSPRRPRPDNSFFQTSRAGSSTGSELNSPFLSDGGAPAAAPAPPGHSGPWWKRLGSPSGPNTENRRVNGTAGEMGCGGAPLPPPGAPRRNLLVVPAGDDWRAERWLDRLEAASFNIVALHHGDDPSFTCPRCVSVVEMKGPKWRLYHQFTTLPEWPTYAATYDYIMLPDDDLLMDTCSINKLFLVAAAHDLLLAQPSVCAAGGSATWRPELHQQPQYLLRFTTFVEVMAPTFRMDFFDRVVASTFSRYWTYVGWGLDSIWPALLHYPRDRVAVVDAVCMGHVPSAGGLGASGGKRHSVYAPGLSPYTAKQEELITFSAFNYTAATTAALGERFMSSRIVGAIPNWKVLRAMAESSGQPWPSPAVLRAYGGEMGADEEALAEMLARGEAGFAEAEAAAVAAVRAGNGGNRRSRRSLGGGRVLVWVGLAMAAMVGGAWTQRRWGGGAGGWAAEHWSGQMGRRWRRSRGPAEVQLKK